MRTLRRSSVLAVTICLVLGACGPSAPEGDEADLRRLETLVDQACSSYLSGIASLQLDADGVALGQFIAAPEVADDAYDVMLQIRTSRVDADYTESEALLHDLPAFGAFDRLADYISAGESQFAGYEVLFAGAVNDGEDDCLRAMDAIDMAETAG